MTAASGPLAAAREAYARREWARAREGYNAARAQGDIPADDLYALADAAWWLGDAEETLSAGEEAYRRYLHGERPRQAAMAAVGIAVSLFLRGDEALGSGWMSRAQRVLRDEPENVEHGYIVYLLEVEAGLDGPDLDAVVASARRVQGIGRQHGDPNLIAAGILGEGRALVRQGLVSAGMALLDEAMLAVLSEELSPDWAGNIYCHMMAACHELADLSRAAEWMEATTRWLDNLPVAVLFSGICRVHRSQVLQTRGAWEQAEQEATRVCEDLADISVATVAEAHYQVGELRRLRGDLEGAESAFRRAHEHGRDPQPGLALVRLAQGRPDAAIGAIRAALAAMTHPLGRAPLCAAQVEIALAARDLAAAGAASDELTGIAATFGSSGLDAAALRARGAVVLAEGHAAEALPTLLAALRAWQDLGALHDGAAVRLLLAHAYALLGDADSAGRELDAAAETFEGLGAMPDIRQIARLRKATGLPGGLTDREAEVLRLVASGRTNREVATGLLISEKTVARHLSNIFTKLDVSSRTEAAAYAFEHGLTGRSHG